MATRIDILKGKPEKAVMNIAIPIFVYLLISNSYNIVDGMWITGIGKDAIAAVGAVPVFVDVFPPFVVFDAVLLIFIVFFLTTNKTLIN